MEYMYHYGNIPGATTVSSVPEKRYTLSSAMFWGSSINPSVATVCVILTSAVTLIRSGAAMQDCRATARSPWAQ